jgi:hypothetical protein
MVFVGIPRRLRLVKRVALHRAKLKSIEHNKRDIRDVDRQGG